MRRTLLVIGLILAATSGAAAVARAEGEPPQEAPSELARQGLESLMRALGGFIDAIPQYEMPEILDNGDIIIRRKRPPEADPPPAEDGDLDQTQT